MPRKYELVLLTNDPDSNMTVRLEVRDPQLIAAARRAILKEPPYGVSMGGWRGGMIAVKIDRLKVLLDADQFAENSADGRDDGTPRAEQPTGMPSAAG